MPTNFEFLKEDYPDLFDWAHDMEKKVKQDPNAVSYTHLTLPTT